MNHPEKRVTALRTDCLNWLKDYCQNKLLDEKWLLAPSQRIGIQWKDRLNLAGAKTVNLHIKTLPALVLDQTSKSIVESGVSYASSQTTMLIVRKVLEQLAGQKRLQYFSETASVEALAEIVANSISDYRLAGLSADEFNFDAFEETAKANDLFKILTTFQAEMGKLKLVDYAHCLDLAIKQIGEIHSLSANILIPHNLEFCKLEQDLIDSLSESGRVARPDGGVKPESTPPPSLSISRAMGEVNEIRSILQALVTGMEGNESEFDRTEILHTDYQAYVPLIHELLTALVPGNQTDVAELPVTFAEGIACIYSRPGRALRGWLRWLDSDCLQTLLVQLVREGLIQFPDDSFSFSRLAHVLRKIPIGMGRDRYSIKLREAVDTVQAKIDSTGSEKEEDDAEVSESDFDFGWAAVNALRECVGSMLDSSPQRESTALDVLKSAKLFLEKYARSANQLDQYAGQKLTEDIENMIAAVQLEPELEPDVWAWLINLPIESRVLASGPMPGRVHVDHVAQGGHSGRSQTFIVGLDDTRFPKRGGQDPLLLDFERQRLSSDLVTAGQRNIQSVANFFELVNRLEGNVYCSCSTTSLSQDRDLYPSSVLLDLFRRASGDADASLADFESHAGIPEAFFEREARRQLSIDDWWAGRLLGLPDPDTRVSELQTGFPHFADAEHARLMREEDKFNEFDGYVPAAGPELDITSTNVKRVSSSRLETFGACPRRYFFKYGLGLWPPEELVLETDRWLDPLAYGSLLHELFESFLAEITSQERTPSVKRDLGRLLELLQQKIDQYADDFPVPNRDAYERQCKQLRKTCEIFLRAEEAYCTSTEAIPWVLEASIGLEEPPRSEVDCGEPIELQLSDGRTLRVGGRIDRIDRLGSGTASFSIWDYKSGSDFGFDEANPFQQGRKLQPYLYLGMLRHRLKETVGDDVQVKYFGYFFPGPKTNGRRIQWTEFDLATGDLVVRQICDLIASGSFIATNEPNDCRYCDYVSICGDAKETAQNSLVKLNHRANASIESFRALREHEVAE